jgi:hypothetical protein
MHRYLFAMLIGLLGLSVMSAQELAGPENPQVNTANSELVSDSVADSVSVTLSTLNGRKFEGTLQSMDSDTVIIETSDGTTPLPVREIMSIVFTEPNPKAAPEDATWVELQGGSVVVTAEFRLTQRTAEIEMWGRKIELPASRVQAVRFRPPSETLDSQWQAIAQSDASGDVLVVRRDAASLDQLEGVVGGVDDTTVNFSLEGEQIPVKRTKLEGIVFLHPREARANDALCEIHDESTSVWHAKSLELSNTEIRFVTTCGLNERIDLRQITRLNFAAGNIAFLSDLEPESVKWSPYFASASSQQLLAQLYLPRRDESFDGDELWLGEGRERTSYQKGLAIHSRTQLVYRLNREYRRLTAMAGIDSRLRGSGHVLLTILGDNQELYREAISGQDPPKKIDLNLEGIGRLTILVDYGKMGDIADHLNLCDARLLK